MTPTGMIKSLTGDWKSITRYDDLLHQEADPIGWPLPRLRGTIVIETVGTGNPESIQRNESNGYSYGLFQIVPYGVGWAGWHELVASKAKLGRVYTRNQVVQALYDPEINIKVGVAILESLYVQHGTLDKANSAFFLGNPNWRGADTVNGNTGEWYRRTLNALIAEQMAFEPEDIISFIVSGAKYTAEFGFNEPNFDEHGRPVNLYHYGVGHGTSAPHMHTGIDIVVPMYTPLRTPLPGVVRCIGNAGYGDWGQGCGSFADTIGGGIGNVTIMADTGHKLTFGHVNSSSLRVGQRVARGDIVAKSGGMVGPHLHLDVSVNRNGSYWLLDPIPAIATALGQEAPEPPPSYAPSLPVFHRDFDPNRVTVTATVDGLPVLQRADPGSAATNKPLAKGDTFDGLAQILGEDGRLWWITGRNNRVPVEGTDAPDWPSTSPVTCPPSPDLSTLDPYLVKAHGAIDALAEAIDSLASN